jgi:hypothetical protein
MSRLRVVPIVEGEGEYACARVLLRRVWEMLGGEFIDVRQPVRQPRGNLVQEGGLGRAVDLARAKLKNPPESSDPALVLILIDADEDCPKTLAPRLLEFGRKAAADVDLACVLVVVEYETWFAAAAESLTKYLDLPDGFIASESPEAERHGKAWVERHFGGTKYSETQDQPGMTAAMDLALCRRRSPSFEKLCRELEQRLQRQAADA